MAVSDGALASGRPVFGTRYEGSARISGWYVTEPGFAGSVTDLRHHHAYHLVASRPELERYLGLPVQWRFYYDADGEDVWRVADDVFNAP